VTEVHATPLDGDTTVKLGPRSKVDIPKYSKSAVSAPMTLMRTVATGYSIRFAVAINSCVKEGAAASLTCAEALPSISSDPGKVPFFG